MSGPSRDEVLALIETGQRDEVVDVVAALGRDAGIGAVVTLLAEVQHEVGRRWHTGAWSVVDEHAATGVVDLALAVASCQVGRCPPVGTVVVACAEEEWHVMPARMLAEELRALSWDVTFIGASVPADHLAAHLAARRPDCSIVSCSVPIYLPGARRAVAASHAAGIPALAGGAAFGPDPLRATAVGADGWAGSAADADRLARSWIARPPSLARALDDRVSLALAADRPGAVAAVLAAMSSGDRHAGARWRSSGVDAGDELDFTVRVIEAALLTRDERLVVEHVRWWAAYLEPLGVDRDAVGAALGALRHALAHHPPACSLLDAATTVLGRSGS